MFRIARFESRISRVPGFWILAAALIGLGAAFLLWRRPPATGSSHPPVGPPGAPTDPAAIREIPAAKFTDITAAAGITFVHVNGAYGEKLLPETMGGGVAFFDCDNDSDQDLLFVNSTWWPDHIPAGQSPATLALYRNDGTGRFTDVTADSGLDVSLYGMGVAIGDYDNDGLADVFVTAVGPNRLFRNLGGGRFRDVTAAAGVAGAPDQWSTSAAFADLDNDGDLDLFVCNYVRWSRDLDLGAEYRLPGIGRAYGPPHKFEGTFPFLYRNEGQGRFTDISAQAGVQVRHPATGRPMAKSLGIAPVDIDGNQCLDLVIANDTVQNFVFSNQCNGAFREVGARSGIAFDAFGFARGAMGIDSARFRNDHALGIAIGNFAHEMNALYVSQGDSLVFTDEAVSEGVGPASQSLLKFGLFFFDYDLDGRLDVLTANGHLDPEIQKAQKDQQYRQPAQLFWKRAHGQSPGYIEVPSEKCGPDLFEPIVGRGSAFADIDADGDLDVVLTQIAGPPLLLRNDQTLGHRWLRLKLVGTRSNRDAIGAWIRVRVGNQVLSRQVMPTRGYLSQSELPVTIGLGKAARVESVEVQWPDGAVQKIERVNLNQLTVIHQAR